MMSTATVTIDGEDIRITLDVRGEHVPAMAEALRLLADEIEEPSELLSQETRVH